MGWGPSTCKEKVDFVLRSQALRLQRHSMRGADSPIVLTSECRGLTLSLRTSVGSVQFRVTNPNCGAPMSLLKIASVPPATVEPQASVLEAVETMAEHGVGAVAVVEKGELRGIFTERDLMLRVVLRGR